MKIVVVTPSLSGGGAEKVAVNLSNAWAKEGHQVHLVVVLDILDYINQVDTSVCLHRLKQKRIRTSFWAVAKQLRLLDSDCILAVHRSVNVIVSLGLGVRRRPVLLFREANPVSVLRGFSRFFYFFAMWICYRRASFIIANSPGTGEDLATHNICSPEKIKVLPNPVVPRYIDQCALEPANHRWFEDDSVKVIIAVGRLHHQKGFDVLIDAMAIALKRRSDIRLLILGKGQERLALEQRVLRHGISEMVELHGFVNNVYPYLKHSRLFVLSSRFEGFGNVLAESMAIGTPIVATRCGGGPEFITEDGKWGTLVEKNDARELSDAMLGVLDHDFDKVALMERGREFAIDTVARDYLSLVETLRSG